MHITAMFFVQGRGGTKRRTPLCCRVGGCYVLIHKLLSNEYDQKVTASSARWSSPAAASREQLLCVFKMIMNNKLQDVIFTRT
jgi:hypothetical protein